MTAHGGSYHPHQTSEQVYVRPQGYKLMRYILNKLRDAAIWLTCFFLLVVALGLMQTGPTIIAKLISPNW